MAGSYAHMQHGWSLIENMGDAYELTAELFYLVRAHLDAEQITRALEIFHQFRRGERSAIAGHSVFDDAYIATQEKMGS